MSKSIIKQNRVYITQPSTYINCKVTKPFCECDAVNGIIKLYVDNISDFDNNGWISNLDETNKYYYFNKNFNLIDNVIYNYFTINLYDSYNNKKKWNGLIGCTFGVGVCLKQFKAINDISNNTNNVTNIYSGNNGDLSGWYVNGQSQQATLKVSDSSVIIPGAIRFLNNTDTKGKFQGCISVNGNTSEWIDFNSTKGDKGDPGKDINTTLKHINIGSGSGLLFNKLEINNKDTVDNNKDTVDNNKDFAGTVSFRTLKSGLTLNNGKYTESIKINTIDNNVELMINDDIINNTIDLTESIDNIKGDCMTEPFYSYGEKARVNIYPGSNIVAGQVVILKEYTSENGKIYYGIKPAGFNNKNDLNKYNTGYGAIFGLSCESGVGGDKITVLKRGIGIIKIGNNIGGLETMSIPNVDYIGRVVIMDKEGYGFNCQLENLLPDPHIELGYFMESGSNISATGNYALINFNPVINDL